MGPHDDGDGTEKQEPRAREQGTEARGQGIGIERLGAAGPGARRPLQRGREGREMGERAERKKIVEKNGKEWKKMENFFLSLWLA